MRIYDLEKINVELDPQDRELMSMFSGSRPSSINNHVVVVGRKHFFILRKDLISIFNKRATAMLKLAVSLTAVLCGVKALNTAISGTGNPWIWWVGLLICMLSGLWKIPTEVKF